MTFVGNELTVHEKAPDRRGPIEGFLPLPKARGRPIYRVARGS